MKQSAVLVLAGVLSISAVYAREPADSSKVLIELHTIAATDQVPFWVEISRLGRVNDDLPFQQLVILNWEETLSDPGKRFVIDYGAVVGTRLGRASSLFAEQYWGRISKGDFYFLAGAKGEPVWENGLSHTNGDFFLSNNARPNPRIELGAEGFRPFRKSWFRRLSVDGRYAEYLLLDNRFVKHANLHHKKIVLHFQLSKELTFYTGLDHWVFWGGISPTTEIGRLPGFKYYLKYVLGKNGGEDSPETDQDNIAGNQLGQNLFGLDIQKQQYRMKFYYQHLFEDGSGFLFHNMQDGFWGVSFRLLKARPLIQGLVIEFMNTTNQSGPYHQYAPDPASPDSLIGEGRDNYFNHGVYHSGFVSYNRMIGSPYFIPEIKNGISTGFQSTRIRGLNGAVDGYLSERIYWSARAAYSRYYGQYGAPFPRFKELFSAETTMQVTMRRQPVSWRLKLAADLGDYLDRSWGCEFSVIYRIH